MSKVHDNTFHFRHYVTETQIAQQRIPVEPYVKRRAFESLADAMVKHKLKCEPDGLGGLVYSMDVIVLTRSELMALIERRARDLAIGTPFEVFDRVPL